MKQKKIFNKPTKQRIGKSLTKIKAANSELLKEKEKAEIEIKRLKKIIADHEEMVIIINHNLATLITHV